MAIDKKMGSAINEQINAELFSAYLYQAMAADFESKNLKGMANWMNIQAKEEVSHAMKFYHYLVEKGGKIELMAIDKPKSSWETPLEAFEEALAHEKKVTSLIYNLFELSTQLKDYATQSMLKWFIDEQVEEEANAEENVEKIKMVSNAPGGLFMIDREMGARK